MVKQKVYERFKKASARLSNVEREMFIVRDLLEEVEFDGYDLDADRINSIYTRCAEILDEHSDALKEFQICDHNANYAFDIDVSNLLSQRELMIKIMRCAINTEEWDREAIANMAQKFLREASVE
jgi:hypothetical protein